MKHDLFISHASEDKDVVARPLAALLSKKGYRVWFDEFELKLGDSLSRTIDRGLTESRYGLVILSKSFFAKRWPERELSGLVSREMASGEKVILPIWHEVTAEEVIKYSSPLADKFAVNTNLGIPKLAEKIASDLGEPKKRPPEELAYQDLPPSYRRALIHNAKEAHAFEADDLGKLMDSDHILKQARAKETNLELIEEIQQAQNHVEQELKKVFADMEQTNPSW